jgi:hypothetical protein
VVTSLYCDPYWNAMGSSLKDQTDFIGDPDGEPYVVRISNSSWIPVSVLIFAASEGDAKERVLLGLHNIEARKSIYSNVEKVLKLAENGGMRVEKFDKRYLAKAVWAGNDNLA